MSAAASPLEQFRVVLQGCSEVTVEVATRNISAQTKEKALLLQQVIGVLLTDPSMTDYLPRLRLEQMTLQPNIDVINETLPGGRVTVIGATTRSVQVRDSASPVGPRAMAGDIASFEELSLLQGLNGVSLRTIQERARPGGWSTGGFIAGNEEFLDVLKRDWKTVSELGLTHTELAEHIESMRSQAGVWYSEATARIRYDYTRLPGMKALVENIQGSTSFPHQPQPIQVTVDGYGGFQEDIFKSGDRANVFNGSGAVVNERNWCRDFVFTNTDTNATIKVPYGLIEYIKRYGFYEGTTAYRVDPVQLISVITGQDAQIVRQYLQTKLDAAAAASPVDRLSAKTKAATGCTMKMVGLFLLTSALAYSGYLLRKQIYGL